MGGESCVMDCLDGWMGRRDWDFGNRFIFYFWDFIFIYFSF